MKKLLHDKKVKARVLDLNNLERKRILKEIALLRDDSFNVNGPKNVCPSISN